MSVTVKLAQSRISVPPGEQVLLEVNVANTGTVVDRFAVTVLGDAVQWATVEPPSIALNPGTAGSVFVRFDVPRSSAVASGEVPFAVKVTSQEDPAGSIVEEGVLSIGAFADMFAELVPRTARGRRRTAHQLAVDNRGNTRLNIDLKAKDPDGVLAFTVRPPTLVAEPSTASFASITAHARKPFLRGSPRTHPFQVTASVEGQVPLTVDGVMLQEPRLPPWSLRAALAGLAALLLLALLWVAVVRPQVKSTAKDVIREPLARTNEAVNKVGAAVGQNPGLPTEGDAVTAEAEAETPPTTAPADAASAVATSFGSPFNRRLAVDGVGTIEDSFEIEDGKIFSLTDLVLQNPNGDTGTMTVLRGGQVLFQESLANFRSVDYHFVAPIVFDEGNTVVLRVECRNTGPNCTAATQVSGFLKTKGG